MKRSYGGSDCTPDYMLSRPGNGASEMYDDLVWRLRECATEAGTCKTCALDSNPSCTDYLMKKAADAIEELSKQHETQRQNLIVLMNDKPRWIPVTEQLPLLNTPVLATDGIEVDISWMYGVPPRWITSYTAIDEDKLTHWMPLPQTPKKEEV